MPPRAPLCSRSLPAPLRSLTAVDYVFIAADYSQIEVRLMYVFLPMRERAWQCGGGRERTPRLRCRVVVSSVVNHPHMCVPACVRSPQLKLGRAHLCGDRSLCELFHGSGDVYASLAAHVFSVPTRAVSPVQRKQAKVVALGILYGIGAPEVAKQVRTSRACVQQPVCAFVRAGVRACGRVRVPSCGCLCHVRGVCR